MQVFQRVADEGSFAAAARALDMSPAAVTRAVAELEQHLGARLLQRTTRKLALTDTGEAYLRRVRSILQEIDDVEATVSASAQTLQGMVRVQASPLLASYFLAGHIARWHQQYPKVALEIVVEPFPHLHVEEFDVTFMTVEEGFDANVVARPLATTEFIVCAAPEYLARAGTPQQPQDLAQHDYLKFLRQQGGGTSRRYLPLRRVDGMGAPVNVEMPVLLQSVSFEVLYRAALHGAGVAVLSRLLVAPDLQSGALVHLLPEWIFGRSTIYAAVPTRKLMPARVRAMLDFMSAFLPGRIA